MKFVNPEINHVFDTEQDGVNTLVIENPPLLFRMLTDIRGQIEGSHGRCVISEDGTPLRADKNAELLTEFVGFEINKKLLLSRAAAELEQRITEGELYGEAMELLRSAELLLMNAAFEVGGDLIFPKMSINSMIKASGLTFREEYSSLAEKLIDYMELVNEYERKKLFFLYNLRSLIDDGECEKFLATVLSHGYNVIMLESCEHSLLQLERRYVVDSDLCEIS